MRVTGSAVVLGDDVDTDTIFPGRYLAILRPEDQARHLFEPLGEALRRRVVDGGVIVAGWNFGCGSSREHAVTAIRTRMSRGGVPGLTREEVGEPVGNALNDNLIRELVLSTTLVPPDLEMLGDT